MQTPVLAPAAPVLHRCLNCEAELVGEYCHGCGQHHAEARLTLRTVSREFVERFFSLERGLLRTFVEMCVDPGGVVRRYAAGQRRRYVSPLAYLLLGVALLLLSYELVEPQMRAWMQASIASSMAEMDRGVRDAGSQRAVGLTADQIRLSTEIMLRLSKQTTIAAFAVTLPFAALLRLFFRSSGVNIAETTAFTLYCFGHIFLLGALLSTPLVLAGVGMGTVTNGSLLLYFVVPAFAALGFFGRRVGVVLKTLLAMALAYGAFTLVFWIGVLVYVLRAA